MVEVWSRPNRGLDGTSHIIARISLAHVKIYANNALGKTKNSSTWCFLNFGTSQLVTRVQSKLDILNAQTITYKTTTKDPNLTSNSDSVSVAGCLPCQQNPTKICLGHGLLRIKSMSVLPPGQNTTKRDKTNNKKHTQQGMKNILDFLLKIDEQDWF